MSLWWGCIIGTVADVLSTANTSGLWGVVLLSTMAQFMVVYFPFDSGVVNSFRAYDGTVGCVLCLLF